MDCDYDDDGAGVMGMMIMTTTMGIRVRRVMAIPAKGMERDYC